MSERPKPPRNSPLQRSTPGDAVETALSAALRMWPDVPKSDADWAHFGARIEARIALTKRAKSLDSISDEQLLGSPLPEAEKASHKSALSGGETGRAISVDRTAAAPHEFVHAPVSEPGPLEGSMGQSTHERDRDRRGFKELAKLAGPTPPLKASSISGIRPTTTEHDSGMVDLAALASANPGAVDRASVTPLASETLFEAEPAAKARASGVAARGPSPAKPGPLVSPSTPRPIVSPPSAPRPIVSAQSAVRRPAPARSSALGVIGAVIGLAAIAAGAFFVVRTVRAPVAGGVARSPVAAEAQAAAVARAPAPTPATDPGVDPLSLPKEMAGTTGARHAAHAWHGHGAQTLVAKADPKEAEEAAPAAKAQPAAKEAPSPPVPPPPNNALFNSMKLAASSAPATPAPEAATPEAAPVPAAATIGASGGQNAGSGSAGAQRPSQGQVTGALRAVLPTASACLGDDDGVSRAHVTFGSDGAVQSVAVSGFAAGKPSEACIKTALAKAHVPPFAEASYGATVTVRP